MTAGPAREVHYRTTDQTLAALGAVRPRHVYLGERAYQKLANDGSHFLFIDFRDNSGLVHSGGIVEKRLDFFSKQYAELQRVLQGVGSQRFAGDIRVDYKTGQVYEMAHLVNAGRALFNPDCVAETARWHERVNEVVSAYGLHRSITYLDNGPRLIPGDRFKDPSAYVDVRAGQTHLVAVTYQDPTEVISKIRLDNPGEWRVQDLSAAYRWADFLLGNKLVRGGQGEL